MSAAGISVDRETLPFDDKEDQYSQWTVNRDNRGKEMGLLDWNWDCLKENKIILRP